MNKLGKITYLIVLIVLGGCSGKSFTEIQKESKENALQYHLSMISPVVPAALQEVRKYKAKCGGNYCNVHSKRAREVKNIVWHALGYVPVDAKPGTVFRDLINEWEEFQRAG